MGVIIPGGIMPGGEQTAYDRASSLAWAERTMAQPRECWWNAVRAVRRSRGQIGVYTEGLICMAGHGIVTEHGWITTPEGQVIDPTAPVVNGASERHRYFPAFVYTFEELRGKPDKAFPLYCKGGRDYSGSRTAAWLAAMDAAYFAGTGHRLTDWMKGDRDGTQD